jgi:hypothetical protein
MAKDQLKSGTKVHLVLASGKHAPAVVTGVKSAGLIDLEAEVGGQTVVITSSPLDEQGKRPDSWHYPEEEAEARAAEQPAGAGKAQ